MCRSPSSLKRISIPFSQVHWFFHYYSKNTGYLTKITFAEGVSSYFSNYSKIGGFTLSEKERTITQEGAIEDVYITEFVINPKYDLGIFDF